MDPYAPNFKHPPGFYALKNNANPNPNLIAFSNQPQFFSEDRNLKYQFPTPPNKGLEFLDPNRNTSSNFKAEGIPNIYKANPEAIVEHLDLDNFKAKLCPINYTHNHKHCPFYHNTKDRKRVGNFYISELCEYCDNCPNGDKCRKSHNRVEQLYRLEKYKTKFCSFYPANLDQCDYGIYCSFAHSESDIVVDLIHNYEYDKDFFMFIFKTVWCPFNLIQHDRGLCVYAHNYQDFRRKPNRVAYDPTPCPNWKTSEFIVNYEDACLNHYNCDKSHGWKESEFHPLNYKTRPCPNGINCPKTLDCPFFHNPQDQRLIGQQIHCKVFKYSPKNRMVTNTFKLTNVPGTNQSNFDAQERHNSLTNLNSLNQDFEKSLKLYPEFNEAPQYLNQRNNSVPLFKHNSSTNIPIMQPTEEQRSHLYSMNNYDFNSLQSFEKSAQNKNAGTYKNMMWGAKTPNQSNQSFMVKAGQPQMKGYQNPIGSGQGQVYPQRNSPSSVQKTNKKLSENSAKNPTHFQIKSTQVHENFSVKGNSIGFSPFPNVNLMNVDEEMKEDLSATDKKKVKNDGSVKGLNESGLNAESLEIKGNERLRKIVMLENNDEFVKEKNKECKYDLESSYDDHNENILKQICEEDLK